jgi:hypothetical protein
MTKPAANGKMKVSPKPSKKKDDTINEISEAVLLMLDKIESISTRLEKVEGRMGL